MLKQERKLIDWLIGKRNILFFLIVTIFALAARMPALDHVSSDMGTFLIPWAEAFQKQGGFGAMRSQIGDYNILYQTIVILLTKLPGSIVHLYKYVSITFDFLLALSCAWILAREMGEKPFGVTFQTVYAVVIFLPTVFLNSAVWGQCDAMYGFLCVLALYTLYKERYPLSFVLLGLALALKLQSVFIIPVYLYVYVSRKNFSLLYFLLALAVLWATGIPAYLQGRSLTAILEIYLNQTREYAGMSFNFPSFWVLFFPDYKSMHTCAMLVTVLILGLFLYRFLGKQQVLDGGFESFLVISAWSAWTCVLFLPGMHERYAYLSDLLLVLLAIVSPRYRAYAAICVGISGITYSNYLQNFDWTWSSMIQYLAPIAIGTWLCFTFRRLPSCLAAAAGEKQAAEGKEK